MPNHDDHNNDEEQLESGKQPVFRGGLCRICNFSYSDSPEDLRLHRRRHNETVNGLKIKPIVSDKRLVERDGFSTYLIEPRSPQRQHDRAAKIARQAKQDYDDLMPTPYDAYERRLYWRTKTQAFWIAHNERAVAFTVICWRPCDDMIYHWSDWEKEPFARHSGSQERWAFNYIWVLRKFRRQRLARQLVQDVAAYIHTPVGEIAWLAPFSDKGEKLARSLGTDGVYLTW